jgi:hypothetical protein
MSITFTCPEAPVRKVPCKHVEDCKETGVPCRPDCDGTTEESEAPECNFANDNALDIMRLVDLPIDYFGEIKVKDIPKLQRALLVTINQPSKRKHLIREPYASNHYIDCGNTDEWTLVRLHALRALATYAQEHHLRIVWY